MLVTGRRLKLTIVLGLVEGPGREADDRVRHRGRRLKLTTVLVTTGPPADARLGLVPSMFVTRGRRSARPGRGAGA
jgi:hypothetical protein